MQFTPAIIAAETARIEATSAPIVTSNINPEIRFGKPCIRGTRITVGDVLGYLAGGMSEDQILSDFPQLTREDVRACLAYAAERERRTHSVPAA